MHLGRIVGRLVATTKSPALEGVALQLLQPLDEHGAASGQVVVACSTLGLGPGDLVTWIDGREAALVCPDTYVPVDASITGFAEQVASGSDLIGTEGA